MSILVVLRFPVAHQDLITLARSNRVLLEPILELFKKHGRISHRAAAAGQSFIDVDEWPSREVYAAFKREAAPYIDDFEAALGCRSTEEVYDRVE
jgi:hypothetical protein